MPSGASPRPTKSSAARTFSAAAMRFATLGQTPSFSSAAFPYIPAGMYGKAALEKLGVWPSVANRIAAAENVRAALLLVGRGEAPLGIVYGTDAEIEPRVRIIATFPPYTHP